MRFESVIAAKVDDLEIEYFLNDPDDNPDRFGDGNYYRQPGEVSWNGPWDGPEECRELYRGWLERYYASLERKLAIYEREPRRGTRRYLVKFDGLLDPIASDVRFFLWIVGQGHPAPMNAVIDASSIDDIKALFEGTVLTYGKLEISEVQGTVEGICREHGLPQPVSGPS